ncbi:MAG: nucleoside 2-deoxyribosyltransferase domain-containing protein [Bacteroidales bacterium]|nr:nucleoside 2-deoxyribosyltransferase domain-containing protein [Bacteroidales bacterium]MDD4670837.1 nucleoside 2-deoxyribosyltransferase domain-containing protein [Bacteroidales bacterium]
MKKIVLYIVMGAVLAACSDNREPLTAVLHPHEELPVEIDEDKSFTKIFLAGTIDMGNSRDWQTEVEEYFESLNGRYILFNPRQDHWDATREGEMDYQVNWELDHLEEADYIIMYILGSSASPVTLLEMGLHMKSGKIMVCCEKDFYRYDNVRITCAKYGVPLYDDLHLMLATLSAKMAKCRK